jgi:hypothetical protein
LQRLEQGANADTQPKPDHWASPRIEQGQQQPQGRNRRDLTEPTGEASNPLTATAEQPSARVRLQAFLQLLSGDHEIIWKQRQHKVAAGENHQRGNQGTTPTMGKSDAKLEQAPTSEHPQQNADHGADRLGE